MPHHLEAETDCYFITTDTEARLPLFTDHENARIVIQALYQLRANDRIRLHAFVVMPDHLHFVSTLAPGETTASIMHSLKSYTANEINRNRPESSRVWQRGYYSHGIRNEKDAVEKIQYILNNPVRAELSESAVEYEFSSANEAVETDPW